MLLIGSEAIKRWYPEFPREPKDRDFATKRNLKNPERGIEYLHNPVLVEWYNMTDICPPSGLLTLKMSHIFWDIKRDKHLHDIQWLLAQGVRPIPALFYQLYEFWTEKHGKNKRSDLNMTADEFFDNALTCKHDHDYLHTLINPTPTYFKVLKDGADVDVCEDKFNALTHEEKAALVREEVYIMAYERFSSDYWVVAYRKMLKKFLINHAPLWEAYWILINYSELNNPEYNFVEKINNGLTRNQSANYAESNS